MTRAFLAAVLLAAASLARADAGAADAAKTYRLETAGTTAEVEVGKPGVLVLSIVPVETVHVDARAPLKIALEGTPGLKLSKTELGKADPVDPKAAGRRFEVPFVAEAKGKHEARAKLDFFVCTDQWCVKQVREVTVAIQAR
ncbi:MAG TPA: hypothetical protein VF875_08185 [Anaeromyxobacter sp.]